MCFDSYRLMLNPNHHTSMFLSIITILIIVIRKGDFIEKKNTDCFTFICGRWRGTCTRNIDVTDKRHRRYSG